MLHNENPAAATFGWKDAWDSYDDPELPQIAKYELPKPKAADDGDALQQRVIHEGDQFWSVEERYMITVTAVRTKVYLGVAAERGTEGGDCVFYETDHHPPRPRGGFTESYHPHRDGEPFFMDVDRFAWYILTDALVPHTDNGVTPPP